jgi:hypothetical protein
MILRAFRFASPKAWHRAHGCAVAAVVDVCVDVGLAPVGPVAVAVRPPLVASILTLAAAAHGCRVRNVLACHSTGATVVDVVPHIDLTSILHVLVAIRPPGVASILTLAVAALRRSIRDSLVALHSTPTTVVDVLACVRLAPIFHHVVVAVLPISLASVVTFLIVARRGSIGDNLVALHSTSTTVVDVLACVRLAPISHHIVVAVLPPCLASVVTFLVVALGGSVGDSHVALHSTAAAVVGILPDVCLAPILGILVAVLPSGLASVATFAVAALG